MIKTIAKWNKSNPILFKKLEKIVKANSISVEVNENPSPSGDPWFDNPDNMASINRGIEEMKAGKGQAYSMDEIRNLLGI